MLYMWSLWSTSAVTVKLASLFLASANSCRGLGSAARAGATSPRGKSSPAITAAPPRDLVSSLMVLGLLCNRYQRGHKLPSHTRTVVVRGRPAHPRPPRIHSPGDAAAASSPGGPSGKTP